MFKRRYSFYTNPMHTFPPVHTRPKSHHPIPTNSSIKELVQGGRFVEALEQYVKHWNNGFKPDNFTFPYILKASAQFNDPTMGLIIHNHAIITGFDSNLFVANSLILFYGRFFTHFETIHYLFDKIPQRNIVTWTAAISAFAQNHQFHNAIQLFRDMLITGTKPNSFTMATLLPCFSFSERSTQIHCFLIKHGFESDIFVSTALIDVYAKCKNIISARRVFDEMPLRNLVSWNVIISGYNQNGNEQESLKLFADMQKSRNIQPDSFSIVMTLCSCSSLALPMHGKQIHGHVYRAGLEGTTLVGNGLVDMYGKCGLLELSERVFDKMMGRDVGSWTALITCYGLHGKGTKAISIFEKMKQTRNITPNSVTLIAVLTACSHSCLVEDGFKYFESMTVEFGVEPTMKHYGCMVDLLGRAGLVGEALKFIDNMPIPADVRIWEALLGVATIQVDREAVEIAAKHLIELESNNPEVYVQLANVYANAGKWDDVAKTRAIVESKKLWKRPGLSSIQVVQ